MEAQTPTAVSLVSNVEGARLEQTFTAGTSYGQRFTTGEDAGGYELTSVEVYNYASTIYYTVSVCTVDADGYPTTTCTALTTSKGAGEAVEGLEAFSAPSGTMLEPSTDYAVLIERDSSPFNTSIGQTITLDEDEGGAPGWSIADERALKDSGGSWKTFIGRTMIIRINGISEGTVPDAVAQPTVSPVTGSHTSLDVTWTAPYTGSEAITDYDVQYRRGGSGSWTDAQYDGTGTSTTLTGLSAGESYQVQVRATNDLGTGAWSLAGTGTVPHDPSDATLRDLTLTDADDGVRYAVALDQPFSPATTSYTARAANLVEQITVEPTTANPGARVVYRTGSNTALDDADPDLDGHQVDLDEGENTIRVRVTSEDTNSNKTYKVTVTRVAAGGALFASLVRSESFELPGGGFAWPRFELLLSEAVWMPVGEMLEHVFGVTNGRVERVIRVTSETATVDGVERTVSSHWRLTVLPDNAARPVTVSMTAGRPCAQAGAVCATDGERLGNAPSLELPAWLTVEPAAAVKVQVYDNDVPENRGWLNFVLSVVEADSNGVPPSLEDGIELRMRTVAGGDATPHPGTNKKAPDYYAADDTIIIPPGYSEWEVDLVRLIPDDIDDDDETVDVEVSDAWILRHGVRWTQLSIERRQENVTDSVETGHSVTVVGTIGAPASSTSTNGSLTLQADPTTNTDYGFGVFKVKRSTHSLGNRVCYRIETLDTGTATAGEDFHPKALDRVFRPNETVHHFKVHARRDDADDAGETVDVEISHARYCHDPAKTLTLKTPTQSWTIAEPPAPTMLMNAPPVHEKRKFAMRLTMSDPVANTRDEMRERVVRVTGGRLDTAEPVDGRTDSWELTVDPDGGADVVVTVGGSGSCDDPATLCTEDGEPFDGTSATVEGPGDAAALTAAFEAVPASHDGETSFTMHLAFSAPVANSAADLRDHAVAVDGGSVEAVEPVDGRSDLWALTVAPDGAADVTLSVEAAGTCGAPGVLCTAGGESLSQSVTVTIAATAPTAPSGPAPLTATFVNVPDGHDGQTPFTVEIVFSEVPEGVNNRLMRLLLMVNGGKTKKMRRVDKDKAHRIATIRPRGFDAITLTLPEVPDCALFGALCSAGGGRLESPVTVTIPGPVVVSAEWYTARFEGPGTQPLRFPVTLNRASATAVRVDYRTVDATATGGEDYIETEGTLTFAAGEREKWVEVSVLDDEHDEEPEKFTFELSNAVGAAVGGEPGEGWIYNSDPLPQAWLGRFGRTVADQVLDAVDDRMRAPRASGAAVRLAGRSLGLGPVFGTEAAPEGGEEAAALRAWEAEAEAAQAGRRLAAWLSGAADEEDRSERETRTVTQRELLLGTSFSLTAGAADGAGGSVSLWGRSAVSRFDGREGELSLDGEVASGLLGADWARGRWTAGLVVSHSRGEGGYRGEGGAGTVSSTLTGLYPWGRHALSERVSVWGVAGYGEGTLTLRPEGDDGERLAAIRTDTDLAMGAVGVRGVAVAAPSDGGVELSVTSDALGVRTTSAKVRDLAATEADVTRVRLGLEGSWKGLVLGTGTLEPRLELGARHDGGDAETGFGVDAGGGVLWSDPARGVRAELGGRGLLTHESAGFADRGLAASLVFDPAPASERGPSLTLARTVGAQAAGGMEALLRPETARALGAAEEDALARRRFEARLGYGFAVLGGGWTGVPELGLGWSESARETVFGARLLEARGAGLAFGLDVEGRRVESVAGGEAAPEHRLGLGFGWRLAGARRGSFEVRFEGARVEPGDEAPAHEVGLRLTARW